MAINTLSIPYADFKLHEIIDPEQFDLNNEYTVNKINELIHLLNQITDSIEDGGSGADLISLTPIEGFVSDKLQSFLEAVITQLKSINDGNSGADFIGSTSINGLTGNTVQTQLESLKELFDALNTSLSSLSNRVTTTETRLTNHNHDNRYMTRQELTPYLQGGDTIVREEAFTITSSNNGDGTFTYVDHNGFTHTGELDENGKQIFMLDFEISQHVEAVIDDTLHRSVVSGGLEMLDSRHVKLADVLANGQEVTVMYFERIGITGEHSIVYGDVQPPPTSGSVMWFKVVG